MSEEFEKITHKADLAKYEGCIVAFKHNGLKELGATYATKTNDEGVGFAIITPPMHIDYDFGGANLRALNVLVAGSGEEKQTLIALSDDRLSKVEGVEIRPASEQEIAYIRTQSTQGSHFWYSSGLPSTFDREVERTKVVREQGASG